MTGRELARVAHVIDALTSGGAEKVAVTLANSMITNCDAVHLVATREGGPLRLSVRSEVEYGCLERHGRLGLSAAVRFRRLVHDAGVDVVHAHGSSIYFAGLSLVGGRRRPLIVWHDHNSRLWERRRWHARVGNALSDQVIAVSAEIASWHRAAAGSQALVVANPVTEVGEITAHIDLPGDRETRVVLVGNVRREKNHLGAVRAFARVVAARPDAHLLCVGGLPDRDLEVELRDLVRQLGLPSRVHLLGSRDDVLSVLADCAVGVLFSDAEGLSVALLEYGLMGLPAVATDVGDAGALAARTEGVVLVDAGDEAGWAAETIRLLADEQERTRRGAAFKVVVGRCHSPVGIAEQLVSTYDRLLRRPRRTVRRRVAILVGLSRETPDPSCGSS